LDTSDSPELEAEEAGLVWQNPPSAERMTWSAARFYCEGLGSRLPTVSEARSLIRGCADTQTGGACGVHDGCIEHACWNDSCATCEFDVGPDGGCYRPDEMEGDCGWTWTASSFYHEAQDKAWTILYHYGSVDAAPKTRSYYVRCVQL
jgi:hypothetical protein